MIFIEIIGWIGAVLLLLAYFLLTHKTINSHSKTYHTMNIIGGLLLAINAYFHGAYPSFTMNVIWLFIALYGFYHIFWK